MAEVRRKNRSDGGSSTSPGADSASADETLERLRVMYIDTSWGFGGSTISLGMLMQALPDLDRVVLTSQDPAIYGQWFGDVSVRPLRRRINYQSLGRVREAIKRRFGTSPFAWLLTRLVALGDFLVTLWNAMRVTLLIRRERIDLVHMNNGFLPAEGILAARLSRIPCIVHMRGIPTNPDGRPRPPRNSTRRWVAQVVAISDAVADALVGIGIPADLITTVHNAVDAGRFRADNPNRIAIRNTLGVTDDQVLFGAFGRVIRWKGQRLFLDSVLEAMRSDDRIRAVVVGDVSDGESAYHEELVAMVEASDFADRITFAGFQPNVEDYYAAVDVVVHSSIDPEPFGRVLVEAMSCGCAVIASGEGGPLDIIEHGMSGLLFTPRDEAALTESIVSITKDDALRARVSVAGRDAASARFGPAASAAQIREIYRSCVGQN